MHCVDLGESFPTSIYLQNLASMQPRTSLVKFARSPRTDPPGPGVQVVLWFRPEELVDWVPAIEPYVHEVLLQLEKKKEETSSANLLL